VQEINMKHHPDNAEDGHIFTGEPERMSEVKVAVEVPPPTLADDLLAMLSEGRHSDLTIEAAYGETPPVRFPVHSNILGLRSPVFRAALAHEMSESATRTVTVTGAHWAASNPPAEAPPRHKNTLPLAAL